MAGRVPKLIHFGNDDGNDDKNKDTAVILAGIIVGHSEERKHKVKSTINIAQLLLATSLVVIAICSVISVCCGHPN
jgi:hypothetical protein